MIDESTFFTVTTNDASETVVIEAPVDPPAGPAVPAPATAKKVKGDTANVDTP
jgi:hypothetical protein